MGKFKVGDLVRKIEAGTEHVVTDVNSDYIYLDGQGAGLGWWPSGFDLVSSYDERTKPRAFKVGDRVRIRADADKHWSTVEGVVLEVRGEQAKLKPDMSACYINGDSVMINYRTGDAGFWDFSSLDFLPVPAEELEQLRAFKERALASGYVEPSADDMKAEELIKRWRNGDIEDLNCW